LIDYLCKFSDLVELSQISFLVNHLSVNWQKNI